MTKMSHLNGASFFSEHDALHKLKPLKPLFRVHFVTSPLEERSRTARSIALY